MSKRTVVEVYAALMERIQTEGAEKAYAALLDVFGDAKALASAKATAATTMFRAGGFFNFTDGERGRAKEPHEMSADELARAISSLEAKLNSNAREPNDDDDIFD